MKKPNLKQQHLITAIGRVNPKSAQDLAASNLTESELKNLRSTKWTDLNLDKKQVKMMQSAKALVTSAIAERFNNPNDYQLNRTARKNSHDNLFTTADSNEEISDDELSTVDDNQLQCSEQVLEAEDESIAQAA